MPGTTDVLTFDLREGAAYHPVVVLGPKLLLPDPNSSPTPIDTDILVASTRPKSAGRPADLLSESCSSCVVHGVLHCLGLDDHDEEQFAAMHRLEDAVLEAIGVGAVFRVEPPGDGSVRGQG